MLKRNKKGQFVKRGVRRRRNPAHALVVNPSRPKRRKVVRRPGAPTIIVAGPSRKTAKRRKVVRRRRNPACRAVPKRRVVRRRRNPSTNFLSLALSGAAGYVAAELATKYIYQFGGTMLSGLGQFGGYAVEGAKLIGAYALWSRGHKLLPRDIARGASIGVVVSATKNLVASIMPGVIPSALPINPALSGLMTHDFASGAPSYAGLLEAQPTFGAVYDKNVYTDAAYQF